MSRAGRLPSSAGAGADYGRDDLLAGLRAVGIGAGDLVFVHACAEALGRPTALVDRPRGAALRRLREVVGPTGTHSRADVHVLFLPPAGLRSRRLSRRPAGLWNTFTAFPEYLRALPGAIRSLDPIFSVRASGPAPPSS